MIPSFFCTLTTSLLFIVLVNASVAPEPTAEVSATPDALCPSVRECIDNLDNGRECGTIPVIPGTFLPLPDPELGFLLTEHRPGVYTYFDGVYHTLMAAEGTHFVFVDFPDTPGSNLPDGTGTRLTQAADMIIGDTVPTRIDMVYSHTHLDHIGAGTRFQNYVRTRFPDAELEIYGNMDTLDTLPFSTTGRAPPPTKIIGSEGTVIELGEILSVELSIVGGHTDFDMFAYIPRSNGEPSVGHMNDVIYPKWSPFMNFGTTSDIIDYRNAHDRLLEFENIDVLSGGHVILGTRDDIVTSRDYVDSVIQAAMDSRNAETPEILGAAGAGLFTDPEAPEFGNVWYIGNEVVMRTRIDRCFRTVIEEWGCRLSGLQFNLRSHCFTALNFLCTGL